MAPVPATAAAGSSTREIRRAQRADGPAAVLAIGTANPEKCVTQDEYADFYFRITNSDHLPELKDKLSRICNKSGIEKRFMYVSDELMEAHPEFADRHLPSLDARVEIASKNVPELAAAASAKAIAEWGRPATDITHLIFSTYSGSTLIAFYGPEVGCNDIIVGQALFGDGSGAVIVGADPVDAVERPLFEMAFASQTTIPDSEGAITMQYMKGGMDYHIASGVPEMLAGNVERCLAHAFDSVGVAAKWKDLFWAVHPGGRRILDLIEEALGLENGAMAASRQVLSEFGNMSGTTVIFVLNELRRRFEADGAEGADWGALMAFGPGVTVETVLLRVASGLKPNQ
uniref:Chalcone synthase n=1 Tax=Oryza brachyantha TaxID=4533 RepID=J3ML46_ORYBR